MTCETRLNPDGPGYQLVVTRGPDTQLEPFDALPDLLSREHELLQEWRAQGWTEIAPRIPSDPEPWSGPR